MWILEAFPELKKGYFQGHSLPRFLGWGEGQKLMKASVDGLFANAIKRREYKPLNFILHTEIEAEMQWFISSSDDLDRERQIYQPNMPTEIPPQMQHPMQSTVKCGRSQHKIKAIIDNLFGDDYGEFQSGIPDQLPHPRHEIPPETHEYRSEVPTQMHDLRHEIPLHTADLRRDVAPGPFSSGSDSENMLISKFQSLLIANNQTLTDMLKLEVLQSFRMAPVNTPTNIRTPRVELHKQNDNENLLPKSRLFTCTSNIRYINVSNMV
ncbi:hypothetical protein Hanom_Chr03g00243721 [Helianthus anomalus]